jgi:ubiquinone/menaquinone biosynthesis C-methylase UbiE
MDATSGDENAGGEVAASAEATPVETPVEAAPPVEPPVEAEATPADAAPVEAEAPVVEAAAPKPLEKNPAKNYDEFLGPAVFQPLSAFVLEKAAAQPGERVLDLACGTGIVTMQLPPLVGETGKVVGIDIAAPMLAIAAAKDKPAGCGIEFREGNGIALVDLDNNAFDLLICQQGLQFFPERETGASEMRRVLAPTGRAVVACWKGLEEQGLFQQLVETQSRLLNIPIEKAAMPFSFGDKAVLEQTLLDAGFETVEVVEHELTVTFGEPNELVRRTTASAAAVMPEFADLDIEEAAALVSKVLAPVLAHYTKDGKIVTTMKTNVAIAKR